MAIKSKLRAAGLTLAIAYASEIGQKLRLVPGTFDFPGDFISFTVGVVGILAAEEAISGIGRFINKRKRRQISS